VKILSITCDHDVRCAIATSATYHRYVLQLEERFPGSEMLCELFAKAYLKPYLQELSYQMQRLKYGLGRNAKFKFGAKTGADLAAWSEGVRHLGDWSIFDSRHKALGAMSVLRHFDFVRMKIWTARYRFGM